MLIQQIWQWQRVKLTVAIVSSVLSTICSFIPYFTAYLLFEQLATNKVTSDSALSLALWTTGAIVARFVLLLLSGIFSHVAAYNILWKLRLTIAEKLAMLPLGVVQGRSVGEWKKLINEDVEKLENAIAHQLPDTISAIVAPLTLLIALSVVDWRLTLVLFIPLALSFVMQRLMFRSYGTNVKIYHELLEQMNRSLIQYIRGMSVMKVFQVTGTSFAALRSSIEQYRDFWHYITRHSIHFFIAFFLLTDSALLWTIPLGGYLYSEQLISFATLAIFLIMSLSFLSSLKALLEMGGHLSLIMEGARRITDTLQLQAQASGSLTLSTTPQTIAFNNVTFAYHEQTVLERFSLTISPGEKVALVGASGSGKSTVARLLARFWDVTDGTITYGGIPIQDATFSSWQQQLSFVFQDSFFFHDTIAANLRIAKREATDEELIEVARQACILDKIVSLPQQFETKIGDEGIKLSGGEKQRLAIARALLHNAPFVVLDEATASADYESEYALQQALTELLRHKGAVIIAHRLHTIRNVDKIVVLHEGRLVECGSHDALLAQNGRYATMWHQFIDQHEVIYA